MDKMALKAVGRMQSISRDDEDQAMADYGLIPVLDRILGVTALTALRGGSANSPNQVAAQLGGRAPVSMRRHPVR